MTLDSFDWKTITQAQARRLVGPASAREQAAARRWSASDSAEDKAAWDSALQLWEDLRVFAICGERPGEVGGVDAGAGEGAACSG